MPEWTRGELWDKIVEQAQKNPKYYDLLMSNPRLLMEKQLGIMIPAQVNIKVLEETPDTYYVVLPYFAREGAELSDADLENVAGGKGAGEVIGGILGGPLGGAIGGALDGGGGGASGGVGSAIGGALGGLTGGLVGGGGGMTGGGGGGGGSTCAASDNAVGTTVVDISL
jgi:hypothetical protein